MRTRRSVPAIARRCGACVVLFLGTGLAASQTIKGAPKPKPKPALTGLQKTADQADAAGRQGNLQNQAGGLDGTFNNAQRGGTLEVAGTAADHLQGKKANVVVDPKKSKDQSGQPNRKPDGSMIVPVPGKDVNECEADRPLPELKGNCAEMAGWGSEKLAVMIRACSYAGGMDKDCVKYKGEDQSRLHSATWGHAFPELSGRTRGLHPRRITLGEPPAV